MARKKKALRKTAPKRTAQKKTAAKKTAARKAARKRAAPQRATQKKNWVITTSGDRPMAEIAKDLSKAGFAIDQTLEQIGVFTGKSNEKVVGKARSVRGVTDVSPEQKIDIGPPNSHDTW